MSDSSQAFVDFVLDQLAAVPGVQERRLFGARGLAVDGVNFAILADDSLFFVVDEHSRAKYLAAGMAPFWYTKKTGRVWVRRYHQVPAAVLEEAEQLCDWARESVAIAHRTRDR